jgi:predicted PurR-regulated permease PerM
MAEPSDPSSSQSTPLLDPRLTHLLIWIARIVLFLLALHTLHLLLPALRGALSILSPFLVALVLAYLLDPVVGVVQRRLRLGRVGGLVVLILVLLAVLGLLLGIVLPLLITQLHAAVVGVRALIDEGKIQGLLKVVPPDLRQEVLEGAADVLERWDEYLLMAIRAGGADAAAFAGDMIAGTVGLALAPFGLAVTASFVAVIAFYFLVGFDRIPPKIDSVLPAAHRERVWQVLGRIHENLSGFLRGQILVCLVMGAMITVGLLIVGPRKYAFLIGSLAGAANFIPYLGPVVGATPAVLWAVVTGAGGAAGDTVLQVAMILLVFALAQTIDGIFVSPRIIGSKAAMHPLLVMLALLAGARGGIAGMIVAVPVMIILKAVFVEMVWNPMLAKRAREKAAATERG